MTRRRVHDRDWCTPTHICMHTS